MHFSPEVRASISLEPWLKSPAGAYLLDWERVQFDRIVADLFGFHAVQLGLASLPALTHNRMPHRWLLEQPDGVDASVAPPTLWGDFTDLPFATASLDLVVLPHALERASDPHACLREVDRVLVAGGHVVITGFNALSLWGARQALARVGGRLYLPQRGEFISPRRVRDWLRLLSFEVVGGRYGCYRPAVHAQPWLDRWRFLDAAGDRWWPMLGAAYVLVATKRVRAMRLVGKAWAGKPRKAAVARPIAHGRRQL